MHTSPNERLNMDIIEARALLGVTASATAEEVINACDRLNEPAKFAGDIELFRQHNEAVAVIMLDLGVLTPDTIDNYRAVTNHEITKMGAKIDQTLTELSVLEGEIAADFIASIQRTPEVKASNQPNDQPRRNRRGSRTSKMKKLISFIRRK